MKVVFFAGETVVGVWSAVGAVLFWVKMLHGNLHSDWLTGIRWMWAELRPFYLPGVTLYIGNMVLTGHIIGWNTFNAAMSVLAWFLYKDLDDDDRWKRRKAKLAAMVARKGARLVVVPVSAGSR